MTENELLLVISNIVQSHVEPKKIDVRDIKITLENDIIPRLQNLESCCTSTYNRYASGIDKLDNIQSDINLLKKVVTEHSEKLQTIS